MVFQKVLWWIYGPYKPKPVKGWHREEQSFNITNFRRTVRLKL